MPSAGMMGVKAINRAMLRGSREVLRDGSQ